MLESLEHKNLKRKAKERFIGNGYIVIEEGNIEGKKVDVVILKEFRVHRIIEVIVSQFITEAARRLSSISIDCEKEIVRKYKNKNPLARKIINKIKSQGIIFTEFKL